jgi:hypothetical protein
MPDKAAPAVMQLDSRCLLFGRRKDGARYCIATYSDHTPSDNQVAKITVEKLIPAT